MGVSFWQFFKQLAKEFIYEPFNIANSSIIRGFLLVVGVNSKGRRYRSDFLTQLKTGGPPGRYIIMADLSVADEVWFLFFEFFCCQVTFLSFWGA